MSEYLQIKRQTVCDIADAIRELTGSTDKIKGCDFDDKIKGCSSALDAYIKGATTTINSKADTVAANAFYKNTSIESLNLSNATTIGAYACYQNTALKDVQAPVATDIGDNAFSGCKLLASLSVPKLTTVGSNAFQGTGLANTDCLSTLVTAGESAFYQSVSLVSVNLPECQSLGDNAFRNCTALTHVTLPKLATMVGTPFLSCSALEVVDLSAVTEFTKYAAVSDSYTPALQALVLRGNTVPTRNPLGSSATSRPEGCYIYVPSAMIDAYKADETNKWSLFADYYRALEDYTVDGTVTGALDTTKI